MKLSMLLSPGIWDLLERLRPHLDLTIDLFDPSLAPLLPERDPSVGRTLREIVAEPADGPVGQRIAAALRTGQHQVIAGGEMLAIAFPLRRARDVVGVLAVAQPAPSGGDGSRSNALHRLERLGWSLRGTIEADISTHERLDDEEHRSRWLGTVLRFLEHLYHSGDEHDLFTTLLEGVAIWGDADARVYRRDLEGDYGLAAALPAVLAEGGSPRRIAAALVAGHPDPSRISSIAELEQLGWPAAAGELLILRVPCPALDQSDLLLTVSGAVSPELERVLIVACRTLGTCLERLETSRRRALHDRLSRRLAGCTLRFPAPATALLGDVASAVGAIHARLLLGEGDGEPPRTLAAVGGSQLQQLPNQFPAGGTVARPDRIVVALRVGTRLPGWLDLGADRSRAFTASDAALAEAAAGTLETWLTGALHALSPTGYGGVVAIHGRDFEARIQEEIERARRFNLEAGLLLIETADALQDRHTLALAPIIEALRSQLRTSDLIGRLSSGDVAALLVHTTERGLGTVAGRVAHRLTRLAKDTELPGAILGVAAYPSGGETAGALIRAARESAASLSPPQPPASQYSQRA